MLNLHDFSFVTTSVAAMALMCIPALIVFFFVKKDGFPVFADQHGDFYIACRVISPAILILIAIMMPHAIYDQRTSLKVGLSELEHSPIISQNRMKEIAAMTSSDYHPVSADVFDMFREEDHVTRPRHFIHTLEEAGVFEFVVVKYSRHKFSLFGIHQDPELYIVAKRKDGDDSLIFAVNARHFLYGLANTQEITPHQKALHKAMTQFMTAERLE